MKRANRGHEEEEMLDEYDFGKGVRGKFAKEYAEGSNVVMLDPDVFEVFHDAKSVNSMLRAVAKVMKEQAVSAPQSPREE